MVTGINFGIDKVKLWLPTDAVKLKSSWQSNGFTMDRGKVKPTGEVTARPTIFDPSVGGLVEAKKLAKNADGYSIDIDHRGVYLTFNPSSGGRSLAGTGVEVADRSTPIFADLSTYIDAPWDAAILKQVDCTQDSTMHHICPSYRTAWALNSMARQPDNRTEFPDSIRWGRRGHLVSVITYDRGKKIAGGTGVSTNLMRVESQFHSNHGSDKIAKHLGVQNWSHLIAADFDALQESTRLHLATELFKYGQVDAGQLSMPVGDILIEFMQLLSMEKQPTRAINLLCRWHTIDTLLTATNGFDGLAGILYSRGIAKRTVQHIIRNIRLQFQQRATRKNRTKTDSFLSSTFNELYEKFAAAA
jgi:hypothetical protein